MLFMYHKLLVCVPKTLDWTKNFIQQNGLHPKLRKSCLILLSMRELLYCKPCTVHC